MINRKPQPIPVGRPTQRIQSITSHRVMPIRNIIIPTIKPVVRDKRPVLIPAPKARNITPAKAFKKAAKPLDFTHPKDVKFIEPKGSPITTKPLFMTLHTGGGYAEQAQQLEETFKKHNLEYEIVARSSTGNWERNCNLKPNGVSEIVNKYPDRPIVWADADSRIMKYPVLLFEMPDDVDIAYHLHHGKELISSLLYFGATNNAKRICAKWIEMANKFPQQWDQKLLWRVLVDMSSSIVTMELPQHYAYIFDKKTLKEEEIVIKQLQYSRVSKRNRKANLI